LELVDETKFKMSEHSARIFLHFSKSAQIKIDVTPHEKRVLYIDRFGPFWHPSSTSAPKTPLWAQNAHPKPVQERNGGVEGRFPYTEAGFNDYFNFPSSVRVILIALQSVHRHVILALPPNAYPAAVQRPVLNIIFKDHIISYLLFCVRRIFMNQDCKKKH